MFKANERTDFNEFNEADDTVIGSTIKIEGDLISSGSIAVEGEVVGSIKTERGLRVGDKARITANINAGDALISGKVQGNVVVKDKLELTATAEVNGDVAASVLTVSAGAVLNGRCSMTEKKAEEPAVKNEIDEA